MSKNLIIVFVKNLIPGTVKTRLAEELGMDTAMEIYKEMVAYTAEVVDRVKHADKAVYYSEYVEKYDFWDDEKYQKHIQQGNDLGQRMLNAFYDALEQDYEKIILVGTDCFQITAEIIQQGFDKLDSNDFVVGPADDGGYYLIGMKKLLASLFEGKTYGHKNVYTELIEDIEDADLSYAELPRLVDIDVPEDLKKSGIEIVFEDPDEEDELD